MTMLSPNHALQRTAIPWSDRWIDILLGAGYALSAGTGPSLI